MSMDDELLGDDELLPEEGKLAGLDGEDDDALDDKKVDGDAWDDDEEMM